MDVELKQATGVCLCVANHNAGSDEDVVFGAVAGIVGGCQSRRIQESFTRFVFETKFQKKNYVKNV